MEKAERNLFEIYLLQCHNFRTKRIKSLRRINADTSKVGAVDHVCALCLFVPVFWTVWAVCLYNLCLKLRSPLHYKEFCSLNIRQLVLKMIFVLPPSLQDQLNKQRAAEMRLDAERRRLREALEAAEARATRVELGRRSLEGEMQRLKLSLGDRESESQTSQERHNSLLKQVQQADTESFYVHIPKCLI